MSTLRPPAGIQVQDLTSRPPVPNGASCPSAGTTTIIAITQTAMTTPIGTISAAARPNRSCRRRPNSAVKAKPRMGRSGISGTSVSYGIVRAPLTHRVVLVDERRLLVPVDRDHDREAHRRLCRRCRHDDQRDGARLRGEPRDECAKRDEREIDRIEHQLDRHEHADRVAAGEEPERADGEQDPRQDQVCVEVLRDEVECAQHQSASPRSRLARNTPPTTAASSRTLTTSNGRV